MELFEINDNNKSEDEEELDFISQWFDDMSVRPNHFKEPLLDQSSRNLVKQLTEALHQGTSVFVLTVDAVEEYIRIKTQRGDKISDHTLVLVAALFVCYKNIGSATLIKLQHLQNILLELTDRKYGLRRISTAELDMWATLGFKIPICNKVDDMAAVVEKFLGEHCIKVSVQMLCIQILELVVVQWNKIFWDVFEFYRTNGHSLAIFEQLICSKYYLPVSIFICSLKISNFKFILNINKIITKVADVTNIHKDHYCVLASKIIELL